MLKCCYGYSNHGSRKPAGPLKFAARTVTKKIPDPFVSPSDAGDTRHPRLHRPHRSHHRRLCANAGIASVTGTETDPQGYSRQVKMRRAAGVQSSTPTPITMSTA